VPLDMHMLGLRIRKAREARGLSQEEFADLISRDQRAVSEYETGKRKISVTDLPKFAEALGVPLSFLYEEIITPDSFDAALLKEFHRLVSPKAKQAAIEIVRVFTKAVIDDEQ
jgi:transcriptional regulator with XRE-family HTH domain